MTGRILFVDDEERILSAYQRQLRKKFELDTARGGEEGLALIKENGPYAVAVSDLRMPGMDGIQFLRRVRETCPDTVRLMLTGHADLTAAMAAVNEGNIFRFLTKPAPPDALAAVLKAALNQYRLVTAERELLEKTLHGSVKVLTEVLSLTNPMAFSKASRLKRYVSHIADELQLPDAWQFEVAAMLSQVGCVTLAPETLQKAYVGEELSQEEEKTFAAHPEVARELLARIPRLEPVARMIAGQRDPSRAGETVADADERKIVVLGAQVLKIALEFDRLITRGLSQESAVAQLRKNSPESELTIIAALQNLDLTPAGMTARTVSASELETGMIFDEDVWSRRKTLLIASGQEVTFPVLKRLLTYARGVGIVEPIKVLVPSESPEAVQPQHATTG